MVTANNDFKTYPLVLVLYMMFRRNLSKEITYILVCKGSGHTHPENKSAVYCLANCILSPFVSAKKKKENGILALVMPVLQESYDSCILVLFCFIFALYSNILSAKFTWFYSSLVFGVCFVFYGFSFYSSGVLVYLNQKSGQRTSSDNVRARKKK